ncbi:MAG: site-specific DNA-methyltransferase, partial [Planctomycetota bacterium]|nr:site-specific DNA-methyltransferase [Planctomycetota bacterium]
KEDQQSPIRIAYERRNRDLDPQLVWRGKDEQDWSDLVVHAPPLYIQEKVHPKVLIDDLLRQTQRQEKQGKPVQLDLFADFNGIPDGVDKTDFYQHDQNWSNRMILGDSLQVMASLAEREGLRGKVQCIYFDPPYGIKFNSNFQWSTTSRDVKDGKADHITREPEQVKAFRDTWRDGIHSYLTYLRDRFTVARDLLTDSGSIFVQIGDENVHRVRAVMDEIFGEDNFAGEICFFKTSSQSTTGIPSIVDKLICFAKRKDQQKFRPLLREKIPCDMGAKQYSMVIDDLFYEVRPATAEELRLKPRELSGWRFCALGPTTSQGSQDNRSDSYLFQGIKYPVPKNRHWSLSPSEGEDMDKLARIGRLRSGGKGLRSVLLLDDNPTTALDNVWLDTGSGSFGEEQIYVVQTVTKAIQRCILMTTDPGDLVLDPTCGSGTTATVAEQWGRRWITIDTSRVALALARARIMGSRYSYYLLSDSRDGQLKEAEVTGAASSSQPVRGNIRHGFVYERVPHITLKSIANNAEIDVIWDKWQALLEPLREKLNTALGTNWQEWEIPRQLEVEAASFRLPRLPQDKKRLEAASTLHADWWQARIARQKEIDASIAAKAEFEYLYDKPYPDNKKVRVAGPFTVESLSPHRVLGVDENDDLIDTLKEDNAEYAARQSFPQMILENLKTAGVQQTHKEDKITFTALTPWPGDLVCAEGRYLQFPSLQPSPQGDEGAGVEKRAAIFIGPEFGTVTRPDLVAAAREAGDAGFDVLIVCAFNYEAHTTEFSKLGRIPVLKARMNADLHMAEDLKNTGKGNLFVIFGEPDITILPEQDGRLRVKVNGVDVFHPNTGEVRSDGADGIACWFIDADYNEESFFVRHAYFLGANDPYSALKTTLKAEINAEAWATLNSDTSRPFDKPASGRIAVKVINHLGDEVMKVFKV